MRSLARLAQLEPRAPADDLAAVVDVLLERALERQYLWLVADHRHHVDVEGRLQCGVLEELVEHRLGPGVAPELDHQTHPAPIGLIA